MRSIQIVSSLNWIFLSADEFSTRVNKGEVRVSQPDTEYNRTSSDGILGPLVAASRASNPLTKVE